MLEKNIYIFDEEDDRLAATESVLSKHFPSAHISANSWYLPTDKQIDEIFKELHAHLSQERLLVTNIAGIESGLFEKLVECDDPLLTIILNSCYSRQAVQSMHSFDLDKHNIPSIKTPDFVIDTKPSFRDRVKKVLASLPSTNPFNISLTSDKVDLNLALIQSN